MHKRHAQGCEDSAVNKGWMYREKDFTVEDKDQDMYYISVHKESLRTKTKYTDEHIL